MCPAYAKYVSFAKILKKLLELACQCSCQDILIPGHTDHARLQAMQRQNRPSDERDLLMTFHGSDSGNKDLGSVRLSVVGPVGPVGLLDVQIRLDLVIFAWLIWLLLLPSLEDVYASCAVRDGILQMAEFDGVDVGALPSTGHSEMRCRCPIHG